MTTRLVSCLIGITLLAGTAAAGDDLDFRAQLRGSNEVPPVDTRTRGNARFEVDEHLTRMDFRLSVRTHGGVGLLGAAGAHIHCAPAGENGPVVAFLSGVITGGVDGKVKIRATLSDANIVNPACGANLAELVNAMANGLTYVNVHSLANPSGEVRGQIRPEHD